MTILILGGFLGSGKTTVVNKLLEAMNEEGSTVAVVENELGTVGIDQETLDKPALQIVPLFGGCVCCEITGELIVALHGIRNQLNPDYVIVELTGMALLDTMRDYLLKFASLGAAIHLICVVDGSRWDTLVGEIKPILEKQLHNTDLVLINKVDVLDLDPQKLEDIKSLAGHSKLEQCSATSLDSTTLWSKIKENLP